MKKLFALLLCVCLFILPYTSFAADSTASDPVVTLSYLYDSYQPAILSKADTLIADRFEQLLDDFFASFEARSSNAAIYAAYLHNAGYTVDVTYGTGSYSASYGDVYALPLGTYVTLISGSAEFEPANGALVDITEGTDCIGGQALVPGHAYLSADESVCAIRAVAPDTEFSIVGSFAYIGMNPPEYVNTSGAYTVRYEAYADALKEMGLFLGTDMGYELDRAATRVEGVVMLVRLLGEEDAALSYTGSHPFRDVPAWAERYVAYAYHQGYTKGVSGDEFAPGMEIDAAQYLTFLLRALGYDDSAGDFLWSESGEKAVEVGLITASENHAFARYFYRDHVAYTSYHALNIALKDSGMTLAQKLIESGVIRAQDYTDAAVYLI